MRVCFPGELWKVTKYELVFRNFLFGTTFETTYRESSMVKIRKSKMLMCSTSVNRQSYKEPTTLPKIEHLWHFQTIFLNQLFLDIFQLLLLKNCLCKNCHLMKNIAWHHIHFFIFQNRKIDWNPSVLTFQGWSSFKMFLFCSHVCLL